MFASPWAVSFVLNLADSLVPFGLLKSVQIVHEEKQVIVFVLLQWIDAFFYKFI